MQVQAAANSWFYSVPILGWIARDVARDLSNFWYALVILVTLVVLAVKVWGVVALAMVALACVPLMFVILIAITLG